MTPQQPLQRFRSDTVIWAYSQAQATVTAVQLQTEAPVATAAGQQVQTLQVVVRILSFKSYPVACSLCL